MKVRHLVLAFATLSSAYLSWTVLGRKTDAVETPLRVVEVDAPLDGPSDVVAVQPHLVVGDYVSVEALYKKLARTFDVAARSGLLDDQTLVVLPAFVGSPLVFVGEKREVFERARFFDALDLALQSNLPLWLRSFATTPADDRVHAAVFAMKAPIMAALYQQVMSQLAAVFHVTVVGGSILLPRPSVAEGRIVTDDGPLAEVSFVFGREGNVLGMARMVSRPRFYGALVEPGLLEEVNVIETPAGRLGVLIAGDALRFDVADELRRGGAEVLAVPAFVQPDRALDLPWTPPHARLWDFHGEEPTFGEAWERFGPTLRAREIGARAAVVAVLRGALWDLGVDGNSSVLVDDDVTAGPRIDAGAILGARLDPPLVERAAAP
jgi:hypothetical protein